MFTTWAYAEEKEWSDYFGIQKLKISNLFSLLSKCHRKHISDMIRYYHAISITSTNVDKYTKVIKLIKYVHRRDNGISLRNGACSYK